MPVIQHLSEKGALHTIDKEGYVTLAYRDPVGVLTIGPGFTMGSKVFASYWKTTKGRALRMGDMLPRTEGMMLFRKVADEEYGPAVAKHVAPQLQHHFDAAFDTAYNCGTGSLLWKWAQALAHGSVKAAADLLRNTALTAKGKRLPGLVRRRAAAAKLLEHGIYTVGNGPGFADSVSRGTDAIMEYQRQLKELGYYGGSVDGVRGPLTRGAVENFQRDHDLVVDGIVGPATRATLKRAMDEKRARGVAVGGGATTGAGGAAADQVITNQTPDAVGGLLASPLTLVVIAVGVAVTIWVGFWLWNNRGRWIYPVLDRVLPPKTKLPE